MSRPQIASDQAIIMECNDDQSLCQTLKYKTGKNVKEYKIDSEPETLGRNHRKKRNQPRNSLATDIRWQTLGGVILPD